MHPLTTVVTIALPCLCAILLALLHVVRLKSTLDEVEADRVGLAYLYVSFGFYVVHSRIANWLSTYINPLCLKISPDANQRGGLVWFLTAVTGVIQMLALLPLAYRSLALFMTVEPFLADKLADDFEVAAWILSLCLMALLVVSSRQVPSKLMVVRFTLAFCALLAAPAYIVWSAHYIAITSGMVGKILMPHPAA